MALRLRQHPRGPELTEEAMTRGFRSYCEMADWVEQSDLPHGIYFVRADNITSLAGIHEVHYRAGRWPGSFWVEGRGCI